MKTSIRLVDLPRQDFFYRHSTGIAIGAIIFAILVIGYMIWMDDVQLIPILSVSFNLILLFHIYKNSDKLHLTVDHKEIRWRLGGMKKDAVLSRGDLLRTEIGSTSITFHLKEGRKEEFPLGSVGYSKVQVVKAIVKNL
jgi:hypothetical protein